MLPIGELLNLVTTLLSTVLGLLGGLGLGL
jgi:hypothetical protein